MTRTFIRTLAAIAGGDLRCAEINREMDDCVQAEIRRYAKRALGGNCTYSDDDAAMLTVLAELAIDANLHIGKITDQRTLDNIERAKQFRADTRAAAESGAAQ